MEYNKEIVHRLKRIEGQVKGVLSMINDEQECKSVVSQLSAIRSAVDRTIGVVVSSNLEQCMRKSMDAGEETSGLVKEAVELLVKSR